MISDAIIRMAKYTPELIPDAWFGAVPMLAEVAPPILDLKRFSPFLVTLTGITVNPVGFPTTIMRARYDDVRLEEAIVAMPLSTATPMPGAWFLQGKQYVYLNLLDTAGAVNEPIFYSVWAQKPTIAHKLVYGITLTPDEKAIADKLGIADTVDKGLLPLPISQQIEREYFVLGEETRSRVVALAAPNTDTPIENIYTKANEFIVLTRVAATATTAAQNVQLIVDRDNDNNYVTMPTFPLTTLLGGEAACFIPAMSELRLHATCSVVPGLPMAVRYTIKKIRLSNILRVRFGLIAPSEAPGDTGSKVLAGIL